MNDRELQLRLTRAEQQRRQGNPQAALETVRAVLSFDPEHATAHALLALALLDLHRLHAAEIEARRALLEQPELPFAHYAMALVAMARRELPRADEHLDMLLALEPDDPVNYLTKALCLEQRGRLDEALAMLEQALALASDDPHVLAALGSAHHERGQPELAAHYCAQALEADPEHLAAHRLRGWLDLREGNMAEARAHACFVLGHDPADAEAIRLLVAIKARNNPLLAAWWRLNAWLEALDERRRMLVLLGSFVVYRVVTTVLRHRGLPEVADAVQWAWLGLCVYTWVGPGMFRRWLDRERAQVRLRDDY